MTISSQDTASTATDKYAEVLSATAAAADRQSRLSPEAVEALRQYGAFRWRTPAGHGGTWADPVTVARELAELGRSSPSGAWVAGTCAAAKTILAGTFGADAPPQAFDDPDALACGSGVPAAVGVRTAGGIRITGKWPYVSGCEDADWAGLALRVDDTFCWACIPIEDLKIVRTWQLAGMRATGSHTLVADELLVPAAYVTPGELPSASGRIFAALTVLGPVVGAAQGALDLVRAMFGSDRKPFMTNYSRMGESPGARQWLAEASHLVARAEQTMIAVAGAADTPEPTDLDIAELSMALADAGRDCRSAAELMMDLNGAGGFNVDNPLQRYWRDIAVGSRHPHLNPYLAVERLGTALAG